MEENLKVYRVGQGCPTLVGFLGKPDGRFAYDENYLASAAAQPLSHSLPLSKKAFSRREAMPYFEGLIPEGAARRALAATLHTREDDYISMLEFCGLDCIGDLAITSGELPAPPPVHPAVG